MSVEPEAQAGQIEPIQSGPSEPQAQVPAATQQRQLAAVKHGLYVRAPSGLRLRSRRVRRLTARVRQSLPWLQPSDEPAVRGWAELEIVAARVFSVIETRELIGADKRASGLIDMWRRLKLTQIQYERELGMTPASRAELGLTVTQGASVQQRLAAAFAAKAEREGRTS